MQSKITREDAAAYRERWRLLRDRQREEVRLMSVEERLRRLALLMRTCRCMPDPRRRSEEEAVRTLWQRLRERLRA